MGQRKITVLSAVFDDLARVAGGPDFAALSTLISRVTRVPDLVVRDIVVDGINRALVVESATFSEGERCRSCIREWLVSLHE